MRFLRNVSYALAILLCLTFESAWLWSIVRARPFGLEWHSIDDASQRHRVVTLMSGDGCVAVAHQVTDYRRLGGDNWAWFRRHDLGGPRVRRFDAVYFFPRWGAPFDMYSRSWCVAGFGWGARADLQGSSWTAGVPYWALAATCAIPAALGLLRARRRLRRLRRGVCPRCRYDLRASPHRCPECGLELGSESASQAAVLRRHAIVLKTFVFLGVLILITWVTVDHYRDAEMREELRRLGERAMHETDRAPVA